MPRVSAQQVHLGLDGIEDDAIVLTGGEHRAVLEVGSVNFALQGEREQEATVLGFAAFLNGLTFPLQVLVRVRPVDIAGYLDNLERKARRLDGPLSDLAHDHVAFVRRLARSRTLLERRFYVVVPSPVEALPMQRGWWPLGSTARRGANAVDRLRQLTHRCAEVERQLQRCGLPGRRLGDAELAQLLHACWCPDLSRVQRLSPGDPGTLVVSAARDREGTT